MAEKIYPLVCEPGIQRDGTKAASKKWTDGQWVRFQRRLPKSINGWRRVKPQYSYITGLYSVSNPSLYTIGQNAVGTAPLNVTWNPYLQYQPRSIKVTSTSNNSFLTIVGCVNINTWTSVRNNGAGVSLLSDTSGWSMPMPTNYQEDDINYPKASAGVAIFLQNKDGDITQMCNRINLTSGAPYFQNLTGIGPYIAYYTLDTQWTFESGFCNFIPAQNIQGNGTSIMQRITSPTKGSNVLFGIPLYNLNSIQRTYTNNLFTLNYSGSSVTNKNYLRVFPIVYVASLDGSSEATALSANGTTFPSVQPMFQLSHSGNPDGTGLGPRASSGTNYGPFAILPNSTVQVGSSGTGQQYFPYASTTGGTGYIWSTDSVFCSGGVLNMAPYIFFYNYHPWDWGASAPSSTNGYIAYTYPDMQIYTTDATPVKATVPKMPRNGDGIIPEDNATSIIQDIVQVADTNIVYGAQIRGGNNSPSGLFWSLNSLIKASYVGPPAQFQFDTIASNISILSSKCIVEVSGVFYWIGLDQFYSYNGLVQTLNNETNINFFFSNLDVNNAQKIWGTKVGQFNEIWWHWPNKNLNNYNNECNAVLIYNYKDNIWYDSEFPQIDRGLASSGGGRVCGTEISNFPYPIWVDAYAQKDFTPSSTATSNYWFMWLHENNNDMTASGLLVDYNPAENTLFTTLSQKYPIPTSITSRYMSLSAVSPDNNWTGTDKWLRLVRIEPDLIQSSDLVLSLINKKYSKDYDNTLYQNILVPILSNDTQGVCKSQALRYTLMLNQTLNINGTYSFNGVANFPYPRLITITNRSLLYNNNSLYGFTFFVTIIGTYQGQPQQESFSTFNSLANQIVAIGSKLFDSVTSVTGSFLSVNPPPITKETSGNISIGTQIPYGTETDSVESQRLLNFYTDINKQARIFAIKLDQNTLDSNFELGQFLLHFDVGDGRQ